MWRCESCEAIIPADSTFCPYCGKPVTPEPPPTPDPPASRSRSRRTVSVNAPSPDLTRFRQGALRAAGWVGEQPMDRLVAGIGALLVVIGFLAAVAGGPGGYPWLGLGVAALAAAAYLRLDRPGPPRGRD